MLKILACLEADEINDLNTGLDLFRKCPVFCCLPKYSRPAGVIFPAPSCVTCTMLPQPLLASYFNWRITAYNTKLISAVQHHVESAVSTHTSLDPLTHPSLWGSQSILCYYSSFPSAIGLCLLTAGEEGSDCRLHLSQAHCFWFPILGIKAGTVSSDSKGRLHCACTAA